MSESLLARKTGSWLSRPARFSYVFIVLVLGLVTWLHLGGPLVASLFAYLVLKKLHFVKTRGKWLAVIVLVVIMTAATYGLLFFAHHTVRDLPVIADKALPRIIQLAKNNQVELPFTDYDTLKDTVVQEIKTHARYVSQFARLATKQIVLVVIGIVAAIALFLNPTFDTTGRPLPQRGDLYSSCTLEVSRRFRAFFMSFETVIGAQLLISAINTFLTALFVVAVGLPYAVIIIGVTFLCGLLPVIGNLISNTIIVAIGFTVSPEMALSALIFLVVIHKLEYFLNSKIIGSRIRNPVWLTLIALVVGESIMGIPGMILAPVVLFYIKTEASVIPVESKPEPVPAEAS